MKAESGTTDVHIDSITIHTQVSDKPMYMTPERVAEELGLSLPYIRKLIHDGKLPSYKGEGTGGRVHVKTDDAVAFMELRRVLPRG